MKYLKYLIYLFRHKWFVFVECFKYGLIWRGITHDLSKFSPLEFFAYAKFFKDKSGLKDGMYLGGGSAEFEAAWRKHIKINLHHWQCWTREENGEKKVLPIPDKYRKEMLADWRAMKKTLRSQESVKEWYLGHKDKIALHEETRQWLEKELGL